MYKISAIIPIYNAEDYLEDAINSIVNQTFGFKNIELILVDDCSNDNSSDIIKRYADKYGNVVALCTDKNSGLPGKPRNIGIDHSTAPYLIFLDADDEYLPQAFELLYDAIEQEGSDFVMGAHFWNLNGERLRVNILHYCDDTSDVININPLLSQKNFDRVSHNHVAPWGKIFRKSVLEKNDIRFPEDTLAEDTYFYFKTLINSKRVTLLPNNEMYLYNIVENSKSVIHEHNLDKFNYFLNGLIKVKGVLDEVPFSKEIPITSNIGSLLLMFSNLSRKDKKDASLNIYNFEKSLDEKVIFQKKEIEILNNAIMNKQFKRAILISEIYSLLYNNEAIKNVYRKFNAKNKKRYSKE